jgi:hypothetical protein
MPKKITAETDVRILEEIGRHSEGIGTDSLHAYFEDAISRRSLQRHLAQFVAMGRLVREGKQRGVLYRSAPITGDVRICKHVPLVEAAGEVYIPISHEGKEIRDHVCRPRQDADTYRL